MKEKDTTFADALAAPTVHEGIVIVKSRRPRDFCVQGEAIERNLKRAKFVKFEHVYTKFNRGPLPLQKRCFFGVLSNTGKTHFACSHFKNPLVCSHIDKLKQLSPDNDGIVFDDMSFRHWPPEAVIHLLDQEFARDINIRYSTVYIPACTPKIFTHNAENPFYDEALVEEEQRKAIERRLQRVHVPFPLFTKPSLVRTESVALAQVIDLVSTEEESDEITPHQPSYDPTEYAPGFFVPMTPIEEEDETEELSMEL